MIRVYCPDCEEMQDFVEIEPSDENLNDRGQQIKEFECIKCELVFTEDELVES